MSLELWEWRRRMADLYAAARDAGAGEAGWSAWRAGREELFAANPQSPLGAGAALAWFGYDPAWRVAGVVSASESVSASAWRTEEGVFSRLGSVEFTAPHGLGRAELAVWWLDAYAGGAFVPFRDSTAGRETYGGGRYLIDSAKGADLGSAGDRVVLDFNYAYHPSCAYDPRWACPLAPAENRLGFAVAAGERLSLSP
ncbi:MAG: DUF1684 domain-containing protein [Actinomycetota bacterium]